MISPLRWAYHCFISTIQECRKNIAMPNQSIVVVMRLVGLRVVVAKRLIVGPPEILNTIGSGVDITDGA